MIKDEIISIKINNKTAAYYSKINPNLKIGDIINVMSVDVQNGSHVKITGICDYCGTERKISKKSYIYQTKNCVEKFTCSKKCSLIKSMETNIKKYGVSNTFKSDEIKNKIKKTNIEKYGVENPQQSDMIKEKTKSTNIIKYGFESPSMCDHIKEKVKQTNRRKFGFDYPAQSPDIKNKMKISYFNKYGVYNFSKTDDFKNKLYIKSFIKMSNNLKLHGDLLESKNGEYRIVCKQCKNVFSILYTLMYNRMINDEPICTNCNPKKQPLMENDLYDFISANYDGEIIKNSRNVISKELDIYLPDLNLAFEFNGLYWHSDLYKDNKYHLKKTKECASNGLQLIHIWEDDWKYKRKIVESMILHKLGRSKSIWARKCEVRELSDNKLIREFLCENHIQGFVGSSVKLGLFYNEKLVSIMTFGGLRISLNQLKVKGKYELLRFCNLINHNVVGGSSKLLNYFIDRYKPIEIISYSDNSRSNGDMYKKIGFVLKSETPPNYYWVVDGIRKNRFNYRKDILIKRGYDSCLTEYEIMSGLGHYRIFDSGSKKWIISKQD